MAQRDGSLHEAVSEQRPLNSPLFIHHDWANAAHTKNFPSQIFHLDVGGKNSITFPDYSFSSQQSSFFLHHCIGAMASREQE